MVGPPRGEPKEGSPKKNFFWKLLFGSFGITGSFMKQIGGLFLVTSIPTYMNDVLCERFCLVRNLIWYLVHVFCCLRFFLLKPQTAHISKRKPQPKKLGNHKPHLKPHLKSPKPQTALKTARKIAQTANRKTPVPPLY